jgi:hypothetical protein
MVEFSSLNRGQDGPARNPHPNSFVWQWVEVFSPCPLGAGKSARLVRSFWNSILRFVAALPHRLRG